MTFPSRPGNHDELLRVERLLVEGDGLLRVLVEQRRHEILLAGGNVLGHMMSSWIERQDPPVADRGRAKDMEAGLDY